MVSVNIMIHVAAGDLQVGFGASVSLCGRAPEAQEPGSYSRQVDFRVD